MTNEKLKRDIEAATNHKLDCWIRHDGDMWYEGEAKCGPYSTYIWSYFDSRSAARNGLLQQLHHKVFQPS